MSDANPPPAPPTDGALPPTESQQQQQPQQQEQQSQQPATQQPVPDQPSQQVNAITNATDQTPAPAPSAAPAPVSEQAQSQQPQPPQPQPTAQPTDADIDTSIANEMNPTQETTSAGPSNTAPGSPPPQLGPEATHPQAVMEPRIPQKKDASLREFLGKMDEYTPLIPDAVTDYYLTLAGLPPPPQTDRRLARLLALATQKFVADIAADAYQYSRIRSTNTTSNNPLTGLGGAAGFGMGAGGGGGGGGEAEGGAGKKKDAGKNAPLGGPRAGYGGGGAGSGQGRTVLTMEDLGMAVGEYGVNVKRGEFYR